MLAKGYLLAVVFTLLTSSWQVAAGEVRVAVASNFYLPMQKLAALFEEQTGHRVRLSSGSTGRHYAQIRQGAPFDIFFAADSLRPEKLQQEGRVRPDERFTYALGQLAFWFPGWKTGTQATYQQLLQAGEFEHLALANPKLAPYGVAAKEVLLRLGLWDRLKPGIVMGENIAQTYQFIQSGSAQAGFVAYSQLLQQGQSKGRAWLVNNQDYTPVIQQAVVLKHNEAVDDFVTFMQSTKVKMLIRDYGYGTP